jgi:hypothetical protein
MTVCLITLCYLVPTIFFSTQPTQHHRSSSFTPQQIQSKTPQIANNFLIIDKEALKANGINDFFALPKEELDACIAFYKKVIAATNSGDNSIVATCEVSDWLAKAGAQ